MASQKNKIDSSYAFLPLEKISRHLLNLAAPPVSQEGEERKSTESSKPTQGVKTAIASLAKTWSIQATRFLTLKEISLHLFNLGESPVSQEGEVSQRKSAESSKLTSRMKIAMA